MAYVFTHATVLDGTADMEPRPNTTVGRERRGPHRGDRCSR